MSVATKIYTSDELLAMPRGPRYELVEGELPPMSPAGTHHGRISMRVASQLLTFVEQHALGGAVFGADTGFIVSQSPDTVLAPDAAYVVAERTVNTPKFFPGPPDVAIEVVSPTDRHSDLRVKIRRYLDAGTRAVVIIDP